MHESSFIPEHEYRLFDYTPVGICIIDKNLHIQFWNSWLEDWTGLSRQKMIGTDIRDFSPKLGSEYYLKRIETVFCGGTPVIFSPQLHQGIFPIKRYDGSQQVQNIKLTTLPGEDRDNCQVLFSIEDLSEVNLRIKEYKHQKKIAQSEIEQRAKIEKELRSSLAEKEFLIKEIHHRVKNNLTMVAGLIGLQEESLYDHRDEKILLELQNKIKSISLVHEKLYQSVDLETINIRDYLEELLTLLVDSTGRHLPGLNLEHDIAALNLSVDTTIPLALIVTELFLNAMKYAFPQQKTGTISVRFQAASNDEYILSIEDDGIGLPQNFDPNKTESLGFKLIQNFVDQLRGRLEVRQKPVTSFRITIPAESLQQQ